jgi:hypothetical protein
MSGQDRFVFAPRIGQSGFAMYRVQDVEIKTTYDTVQAIVAEKAAAYEAATAAAAEISADIAAKATVIAAKQAQVSALVAGVPVNASSVATLYSELGALQSARTDLQSQHATVSATLSTQTAAVVAKQAEIAELSAQPGNNTVAMAVLVSQLATLTQAQATSQADVAVLTLGIAAKDSAVLAKQAQINISSVAAGFDPTKIATMIVQTTVLETLNETHAALLLQSTNVNTLLTANARAILSKQAQIGILQSKPGDNASAISALQVELTALQTTRVSLETQATQISADLATNNAAITTQQSSINALAAQAGANSAAVALIAVKKISSDALTVETASLQADKLEFEDQTAQLQTVVSVAATPPTNVEWSPELDGELSAVPRLTTVSQDLAQATLADRYAIVAGAIPEGTTFTTEGQLSGTVTTAQQAVWTVRAGTNFPTQFSDKQFSLHVAPEILWQTTTLAVLELQQSGQSRPLVATNALFYAVTGTLPQGMTMSTLGVVSGTPTLLGTYSFTVRATSDHPDIYIDRAFSQQVVATPVWSTPAALTDVAKSEGYSFQLVAPTIDGTTTFAVQSGTLPTGLSMSSSGLLTGTPSVASTVSWTVRATGVNAYADRTFTLLVANRPAWTTAAALANTSQSVAYSTTLLATNGFAPGFSVVSGSLPAGATLSDGGVLSGTPTAVATYTFTVRSLSTTSAIIYADRTFTQTTVPLPIWVSTGGAYTDVPQGVAITSVQLSATYGVSYAVLSGSLPTGLSLSSGGLLTGTPSVSGSYSWTVRVTGSATNATTDRAFSMLVATTPTWTTSSAIANVSTEVAYSTTLLATNANPTGFTVTTGALPTGLSLSPSGVLSGTPTAAGSYSFTVRALSTTSNVIFADRAFTQTVVLLPVWTTAAGAFVDFAAGSAYSIQLVATNTLTYTLQTGTLPGGISLSSAGLLSGTPTAGSYSFTVRATGNATNATVDRAFTQSIATTPTWTTAAALANTAQSVAYTTTLVATNALATGYSLLSGTLPAGTTLSTAGVLSGTPTAVASYSFTVRVLSTTSSVIFADRTFTQTTVPLPIWSSPASGALTDVAAGAGYSVQYTATNAVSYAVFSGTLPSGLSLSGAGLLTGTPAAGSYSFTIRATGNAPNATADRAYTQIVATTPTWSTASALSNTAATVAYSITLVATNALATGYSLLSGTLPAGLSLSNSGVLSGTPSATATYSFAVRVLSTTSSVIYADRTFTLTTVPLPVWSSPASGALTTGLTATAYSSVQFSATNALTYSVSSGTLPSGLSLSSGGLLSGTPSTVSSNSFTIRATGDATNAVADREFTLQVIASSPVWTSGGMYEYAAGASVSFQLVASNTVSYALTKGTLPSGLSLSSSGLLSGTPSLSDSYDFAITATGATGATQQSFTVDITTAGSLISGYSTAQISSGLALHMDASALNAGVVTSVPDISGNGRTMADNTAYVKPGMNGKNCLDFKNRVGIRTAKFANSPNATAIMVLQNQLSFGSGNCFWHNSSFQDGKSRFGFNYRIENGTFNIETRNGTSGFSSNADRGVPYIVMIRLNGDALTGTAYRMRDGFTMSASRTYSSTDPNFAFLQMSQRAYLGANPTENSADQSYPPASQLYNYPIDSQIYELLYYTRALSDTEVSNIQTQMIAKWTPSPYDVYWPLNSGYSTSGIVGTYYTVQQSSGVFTGGGVSAMTTTYAGGTAPALNATATQGGSWTVMSLFASEVNVGQPVLNTTYWVPRAGVTLVVGANSTTCTLTLSGVKAVARGQSSASATDVGNSTAAALFGNTATTANTFVVNFWTVSMPVGTPAIQTADPKYAFNSDIFTTTAQGQQVSTGITSVPTTNCLLISFSVYISNANNFNDNDTVDPVFSFGNDVRLRIYPNRIYLRQDSNEANTYASLLSTTVLRQNAYANLTMEVSGTYVRFIAGGYVVQGWQNSGNVSTALTSKTYASVFLNGYDAQYVVRDFSVSNTAFNYPPIPIPANNGTVQDSSYTVSGAPHGNGAYRFRCSDAHWHAGNAFCYDPTGSNVWHGRNLESITLDGTTYGSSSWVRIDMPAPIVLTKYMVYGRNDYAGHRASTWVLYGSSNDGATWTKLHNTSGQTWSRYLPYDQFKWTGPQFQLSTNITPFNSYIIILQSPINSETNIAGGFRFWGYPATLSLLQVYPPRDLTANSETLVGRPYGNGTYVCSASATHDAVTQPYRTATIDRGNYDSGWLCPAGSYNTSTGFPVSSATTLGGYVGQWWQIQLPYAIILKSYTMSCDQDFDMRNPRDYRLLGSNDGSTWALLKTVTGQASVVLDLSVDVSATLEYNRYAFVVERNNADGNSASQYMGISSVQLYGVYWSTASPLLSAIQSDSTNYYMSAYGGTTYSLFSGTLPAGLSLASSGLLSGTPTASATSSFVVRASDGAVVSDKSMTLSVIPAAQVNRQINMSLATNYTNTATYGSSTITTGGDTGNLVFGSVAGRSALRFNNQNGANGYISLTNAGTSSLFSVSMDVYMTESEGGKLFSNAFSPALGPYVYHGGTGFEGDSIEGFANALWPSVANKWTNFAYIFNNGTMSFYLDNKFIYSASVGMSATPLYIGRRRNDQNNGFTGWMSNLRFYNGAVYPAVLTPLIADMADFSTSSPVGSYNVKLVDNTVVTGTWDGTWMKIHDESNNAGSSYTAMWSPTDMTDGSTHGRTSGAGPIQRITFTRVMPLNAYVRYTCQYITNNSWDNESGNVNDGATTFVSFQGDHGNQIIGFDARGSASTVASGNTVNVDIIPGAKTTLVLYHDNGLNSDSSDESMLIRNATVYVRPLVMPTANRILSVDASLASVGGISNGNTALGGTTIGGAVSVTTVSGKNAFDLTSGSYLETGSIPRPQNMTLFYVCQPPQGGMTSAANLFYQENRNDGYSLEQNYSDSNFMTLQTQNLNVSMVPNTLGQRTLYVGTFSGTSRTLRAYTLSNTYSNTQSHSSYTVSGSNTTTRIGNSDAGEAFRGYLHDVEYYNYAMSDAEIAFAVAALKSKWGMSSITVTYLVIAGGGGGGGNGGGGGGAGGYQTGTVTFSPGTVYTVTVGAPGNGTYNTTPSNGNDSTLTGTSVSVSASGGGGGASRDAGGNARSGGSGGGGGGGQTGAGSGIGGQGNNGGSGYSAGGDSSGGGGGGAGGSGGNGQSQLGAAGGVGLSNNITGTAVFYAGGGGGGITVNGNAAAGGNGGGGNGSNGGGGGAGTDGTGGGGGGGGPGATGGNGGSGVVILSIPTAAYTGTRTGTTTVTTSGANTIVRFTSSGSYTA